MTLSAELLGCAGPQLVHGVLTSDSGGPLVSLPLGVKVGPVRVSDASAQAGPRDLLLLAPAPGALASPRWDSLGVWMTGGLWDFIDSLRLRALDSGLGNWDFGLRLVNTVLSVRTSIRTCPADKWAQCHIGHMLCIILMIVRH